ncbi:hypothetical protein [Pararhodobacter sp.]|uniref:hypothetical protein n=1 Tax=Pararhodobacter sp. TaxID=2127056 RepID=UPI002FE1461A
MSDQRGPARLVLHIGLQKTATTAAQQFLQANAAALKPWLTLFTPRKGTPAQQLGRKAFDYTQAPSAESEAAFVAAIRAMKAVLDQTSGTVLISHENLVGAPPGAFGETQLYPFIGRIVALLDAHFAPYRPEFVYYSRDMASWKRSLHNQIVKTDGYTGTWDTFQAMAAPIADWEGFHARLCAAAGAERVTAFRLENQVSRDRPGQQLLRHLGVPDRLLARLAPISGLRNESLNAGALEFMRRANAAGFSPHTLTRLGTLVAASQSLFSPSVVLTQE